jgi:predicted nucleic acid-binding protein
MREPAPRRRARVTSIGLRSLHANAEPRPGGACAYPKLGLGLVDASVIALAERLGETKVATLDRRRFSVVRPRHCEHLELLPG